MVSHFRRRLLLASAGACMLPAPVVHAQSWPQRPIRLIVPYPVGGLTDNVARALGEEVGRILGQTIIVDNRPGAGGKIGFDAVRTAAPDGYTIGEVVPALMVTLPLTDRSFGINPKDFAPISLSVRTTQVLVVDARLNLRSLKDFVAYAKQHPDKLSYGTPGVGTSFHFNVVRMMHDLGLQPGLHAPYKGEAPALTDLAGGVIQYMLTSNPSSALITAGKIVPIAVAAQARLAALPDVPTFAEQGSSFATDGWVGFVAPAAVPTAILDRLSQAFAQALKAPKVQQSLRNMGYVPDGAAGKDFSRIIDAQTADYAALIKSGAIKLD